MDFQLTPEQAELTASLSRLLEKTYEFEARKRIISSEAGHSAEVWSQMAEMGVFGLAVPEPRGGYASGADVAASLAPLMTVIGQTLCLEPVVNQLVSAWLIAQCQQGSSCDELLEQMIQGQAIMSITRHASEGDDACFTIAAPQATHHLLLNDTPASNSHIVNIYIRDQHVTYKSICRTVDNMRAAEIVFSSSAVHTLAPAQGSDAHVLVEAALDLQTLLACAEAVGAMRYACDATLDYLKTRKQFGQPIGAFQALQHRMVDMVNEWELARSMVDMACAKFDAAMRGELTARERAHYVSAAKIKVSDAARLIGQESIQLHGGMGMANEMKISHCFKRLTVIAQLFGDVDFHLARFAATDAAA